LTQFKVFLLILSCQTYVVFLSDIYASYMLTFQHTSVCTVHIYRT